MSWTQQAIAELVSRQHIGYGSSDEAATEPTALAAMALAIHGRLDMAARLGERLRSWQDDDGSLGTGPAEATPRWPTSLAILAWLTLDRHSGQSLFGSCRDRAVQWALEDHGKSAPQQSHIGHDTTIEGWSWAADTHSWIEPTAFFVVALKAAGQAHHVRTRDGVKLLVDRLLPQGGCNYGNTIVLGQALLPHVQPTGVSLLALNDESSDDPRIGKSLDYLARSLPNAKSAPSLSYASLALAAHGRAAAADSALERAFERTLRGNKSGYKIALLLLASRRRDNPFWHSAAQGN